MDGWTTSFLDPWNDMVTNFQTKRVDEEYNAICAKYSKQPSNSHSIQAVSSKLH